MQKGLTKTTLTTLWAALTKSFSFAVIMVDTKWKWSEPELLLWQALAVIMVDTKWKWTEPELYMARSKRCCFSDKVQSYI